MGDPQKIATECVLEASSALWELSSFSCARSLFFRAARRPSVPIGRVVESTPGPSSDSDPTRISTTFQIADSRATRAASSQRQTRPELFIA